MSLSERVKAARTYAGLTQSGLAGVVREKFKLKKFSQQTIQKLENGANKTKFAAEIARACGVNPDWLATGEGDMLGSSGADQLSLDARRIGGMYDKLPLFLQTQVRLFVEMQCTLFDSRGHQFPRQASKGEAEFYRRIGDNWRKLVEADRVKSK